MGYSRSMPLAIGARLARFQILAPIGAGGMGDVYRARDLELGREVALKIMQPDLASDPEFHARFRREARVLAALDHPGIVAVFSAEEADGIHFLTMQLVDGQTIDNAIPPGGMPTTQILATTIMLGDALDAAHSKGIVHRDIKPTNVLLTPDGRIKVLDFGLARSRSTTSVHTTLSEATTRTDAILGTMPYMSPEQLTGQVVDHRSDIFSLGVMLFEMAAARRPFEGGSQAELVSAILRDPPPPLLRLRPDLPAPLAELIESCLAKDPRNRPGSAGQIRDRCESMRRESERDSAPAPRTRPASSPGNLPLSLDSFVAREPELAGIIDRLASVPLVTLTGVGGTGKTRLAIEAAHRLAPTFPDGSWLVDLAPIPHSEAVTNAVGDLLGVVQQPGKTLTQSIVDALRHRALLLVIDNCEHVLDATAQLVTSMTRQCAGVRILATSREPLEVSGEHVFRLQSLTDREGAQLFRDRALAAGAIGELNMETLTRVSHRLDGIPLAIELAAARCGTMSPEDIERRLDDRFRLLRGSRRGRIERHQSLHHTVSWSYELLQPREQHVFDRLSLFAGGFTLEAARAVAGGEEFGDVEVEETIAALVARSMVLAMDAENVTRYRLLETLRQFGEERLLASGETLVTRQRHARYFADFMKRAWAGLWSARPSFWTRAVGREYENLRVAAYAAVDLGDRESLGALMKPLYFWAWHSLRYEVGDWAEAALQVTPEPPFARAVAIHLRFHGGRRADASRLAEGLAAWNDSGDPDSVCISALGHMTAAMASESPEIAEWVRRAIVAAERAGNKALATLLKSMQVLIKTIAGEMDQARRIAVDAYEEARLLGNPITLCEATFFMGRAHADVDPRMALEYFDRVIAIAEQEGLGFYAGIAATEAAAASVRVEEANLSGARLSRALRAFIGSGDRGQLWSSAHHLVYFLLRTGRPDEARRLWQEMGKRRAYVAQHYRDELAKLIGPPGEGKLSDDELIVQVLEVLDRLDG